MKKSNHVLLVIVGLSLFILYILQFAFDISWPWLLEMQADQSYKRWSGVVVGIFILFQWLLTLVRVTKKLRKYNLNFTRWHQWIGAISPVLFYFHALQIGYGYLGLLSYVFFTNMVLGLVNLDVIKSQKNWVFQSWMITHVSLSVVVTFLLFFHIGVVFYYK
ncbi:hypothetical protein NBT05_00995 [Aquimarina sp. ERC-38]|uniref:hypothetical protein n=1 Tax=Aquimarina sp. ERC-38 TaxID=2949996 RepID=UPI0022476DB5|nr:hypothetical protein [Aquimarina sp. ERC-38]UZO81067.1 hypothetical protein NBT05_00995 [Aquimarina sp. ERC-38]